MNELHEPATKILITCDAILNGEFGEVSDQQRMVMGWVRNSAEHIDELAQLHFNEFSKHQDRVTFLGHMRFDLIGKIYNSVKCTTFLLEESESGADPFSESQLVEIRKLHVICQQLNSYISSVTDELEQIRKLR